MLADQRNATVRFFPSERNAISPANEIHDVRGGEPAKKLRLRLRLRLRFARALTLYCDERNRREERHPGSEVRCSKRVDSTPDEDLCAVNASEKELIR